VPTSDALIAALEGSDLAVSIRNSLFLFPLIESVHVLGLTLVFGTIAVVDLRLLGLASTTRPFTAIGADILKYTWTAFAVTVITGVMMFVTNASTYYPNLYFRAKMALLVVSGLNMLAFDLTARKSVATWDRDAAAPAAGRVVAVVSLVVWIGVIALGRWVGFTSAQTSTSPDTGIDFNALEDLIPK
jgi:hypothetical protein